jgi:hypothetical protein
LEKKGEHRGWESLLQHILKEMTNFVTFCGTLEYLSHIITYQERMGLTTNRYGECQVLHSSLNISLTEKLFTHLNFLEKEPLNSLII